MTTNNQLVCWHVYRMPDRAQIVPGRIYFSGHVFTENEGLPVGHKLWGYFVRDDGGVPPAWITLNTDLEIEKE